MTGWLRRNVGLIVSSVGIALLVILTFGNIGELFTNVYWQNVGGNISSIGAMTVGLVMIQVTIKQGISEQALSKGLNTEHTKQKYQEHREIITKNREKSIYLPYFLSIRNRRETKRRKKEYLVDNNFTSEKMLMLSKNKKLIKGYQKICTNITADSIKWSTTEIIYNKNGRIEKLDVYRKKRAFKAIVTGVIMMFATTLVTGGLFLDIADIPLWQKVVKLFTYLIVIFITVIFDIGKNYEKGAFGVPNELDEINGIWKEFELWEVPQWVIDEVENQNNEEIKEDEDDKPVENTETIENTQKENLEQNIDSKIEVAEKLEEKEEESDGRENEQAESGTDTGTALQEEQSESEVV